MNKRNFKLFLPIILLLLFGVTSSSCADSLSFLSPILSEDEFEDETFENTDKNFDESFSESVDQPPVETFLQQTDDLLQNDTDIFPSTEDSEEAIPPKYTDEDKKDTLPSLPPQEDISPDEIYSTVEIAEKTVYLFEGDCHPLKFTVDSTNSTTSDIIWQSATGAIDVSDEGIMTAKKQGYDIIRANGGKDFVEIRILPKEMPTISVNTNNTPITSKDIYVPCTVSLDTTNEEFCISDATAGIRIRGNSTARYKKKPYRIKFDTKTNLLGMNNGAECKSWVLLAEWLDNSMIKNAACLTAAPLLLNEYSSDWRYVRLKIDGKDNGVYLLAEQNQINKNRIDIEEAGMDFPELASGYLYEIDASFTDNDNYTGHDGAFILDYSSYVKDRSIIDLEGDAYTENCSHDIPYVQYIFIKNDGLSDEQYSFAQNYLLSVFKIVMSATYDEEYYVFDENFNLKTAPEGATAEDVISAVIDIDSLARMYLFNELVCSNDEHWKSFYMWVDFSETGTGKLTFGCPWDHDGTVTQWSEDPSNVVYKETEGYFSAKRNLWYVAPMKHEWFTSKVKTIWQETYEDSNSFDLAFSIIDEISVNYQKEFKIEKAIWNRADRQSSRATEVYEWFDARVAWLNSVFGEQKIR